MRNSNGGAMMKTVDDPEPQSVNVYRQNGIGKVTETSSMHAVSEQLDTSSKLMDKQVGSWSIKGNLVSNGRCPKCTLKIPCKHYERPEDLPQVVQKTSPRQRALPPLPPATKT